MLLSYRAKLQCFQSQFQCCILRHKFPLSWLLIFKCLLVTLRFADKTIFLGLFLFFFSLGIGIPRVDSDGFYPFPSMSFSVSIQRINQKTPSAHEGLIRLYTRPSFHLSYLVLYQSVNQRWSPFALGCNSVRCFLTCHPMQGQLRYASQSGKWQKAKNPLVNEL
jgi:hypothetical protein